MHLSRSGLMVALFYGTIARGQVCSWNPSTASTMYGLVGEPAHFSFKSLGPLLNGNLFTWKLDGTTLAAYEYKSNSTSHFAEDEIPITRVNACSKYLSNTRSEHNLTIKSLSASDHGKQVTFRREGCSFISEYAKPVTLLVSCCDPVVFGNNAATSIGETSIKCNDAVIFSCNETMYQTTNFSAVCLSNSTWSIKQHPCIPYCDASVFGISATTSDSKIKYKNEVSFTCNEKIYKTKTFVATCKANGEWNMTQHICVLKSYSVGAGIAFLFFAAGCAITIVTILSAYYVWHKIYGVKKEENVENGTESDEMEKVSLTNVNRPT